MYPLQHTVYRNAMCITLNASIYSRRPVFGGIDLLSESVVLTFPTVITKTGFKKNFMFVFVQNFTIFGANRHALYLSPHPGCATYYCYKFVHFTARQVYSNSCKYNSLAHSYVPHLFCRHAVTAPGLHITIRRH
jgi:hypothetical protein